MLLCLFLPFFDFIALGSSNSIRPESVEEHVAEGRKIKLTCTYEGGIYNIQWYRQYQRSRPEFLLSITEGGLIPQTVSDFTAHINKEKKRVDLEIVSAKVTHSAVYYCALQPDVNQNKLIFGSGTGLNVELIKEYQPSYFKLSENDTTACLATGFSRDKATKEFKIFNKTEAVRIDGDGLYNEVSLIKGNEECPISEESGSCQESLKPDETVNLAGLTILGLRLIFFKTVIFNVLMTLRLWLSH